jgi:hypothetical protein
MATKKPLKTVKKTAKAAKKTVKAVKKTQKGERYTCRVCGLMVTVNEACGCGEAHELICCGKVMKGK